MRHVIILTVSISGKVCHSLG